METVDKESPDIGQSTAIPLQRDTIWRSIPNDRIVNTFTKSNELRPLIQLTDVEQGKYELLHNNLRLTIKSENTLRSFCDQTMQVLDFILCKATESGMPRMVFTTSLAEFMAWRDCKSRNKAAKQLKEGLKALVSIKLRYYIDPKKKRRNVLEELLAGIGDFCFLQNMPDIRRGTRNITIVIGSAYFPLLKKTPLMPYHLILGRLNLHQNKNAYSIGRKVLEHKSMGRTHTSADDTLSVATLFRSCNLPIYENATDAFRKDYSRLVIKPFERDLNALSAMCSWRYCLRGGANLPDGFVITPKNFSSLLIIFTIKNYPKANAPILSHDIHEVVECNEERGGK